MVNFPRNVDEREAYRILEFISGNLDYKINSGSFGGFFSIEDGRLKEKYEAKIEGTISSGDFSERGGFYFSREIIEDSNVFSRIRFNTIPGYSLEEHDRGEVRVWREIKGSVERYFIKYIQEDDSKNN